MLTAAEIMTEALVTVLPTDSIETAIERLLEHEISGMPVVLEDGRPVGVITEFALLAMIYDHQVKDQTVAEHMTQELITVEVDDPVSRVADLCIVHRVRRVPVLDEGRLVGLIARRDVLRALRVVEMPMCVT